MTVPIDQGNIVALGEGIQVRVAQFVAQIARRFGVFDGAEDTRCEVGSAGTAEARPARVAFPFRLSLDRTQAGGFGVSHGILDRKSVV